MQPSFEDLRKDKQPVYFSEGFERLCWPLRDSFPDALSVMQTRLGALDEMAPLQRADGSWHEIALWPLTEPKVSSILARVPLLDQYENNWQAWHEEHEDAEYEEYHGLEEEDAEALVEEGYEAEYIATCCGQDRPVYKDGLRIEVKPAAGKDFVTILDYVSVVHPWIMSLREDIIQAMTVLDDGRSIGLATAREMDWKVSVLGGPRHDILTHKMWLSDCTAPPPISEAERLRYTGY